MLVSILANPDIDLVENLYSSCDNGLSHTNRIRTQIRNSVYTSLYLLLNILQFQFSIHINKKFKRPLSMKVWGVYSVLRATLSIYTFLTNSTPKSSKNYIKRIQESSNIKLQQIRIALPKNCQF